MDTVNPLNEAILNSLSAEVIVINAVGTIIATNEAWRRSVMGDCSVGQNYLELRVQIAKESSYSRHALTGVKSVLSGESASFELEYPRQVEDKRRWVLMQVTPLQHESGGAVIMHIALPKLNASEHIVPKPLQENPTLVLPNILYIHDLVTYRNVYLNYAWVSILGYKLSNAYINRFLHPDVCDGVDRKNNRLLTSGNAAFFETEYQQHHAKGKRNSLRNYELILSCDKDGWPTQNLDVAQKETSQKLVQRTLQDSQQKYQTLVENSLLGICVLKDGQVDFANQAAADFLGYQVNELQGSVWAELIELVYEAHRDSVNDYLKALSTGKRIERSIEAKVKTLSGNFRWLMVSGKPLKLEDQVEILFTAIDISAQKNAENERRKSEEFLKHVIESIQDGIVVLDKNLAVRHANSVMKKWSGNSADLIGKKCHEGYRNTDTPCKNCPTLRALQTGKTEYNIMPGLPGTNVEWLELHSYPIFDKDTGEIDGVVEFIRDITARKQAETELRDSKEKYNCLFQTTQDGIVLHDLNGNILDANATALRYFGYSNEEFLTKNISDLHPPEMQPQFDNAFSLLSTKTTFTFEIEILTKTGSRCLTEVTVNRFKLKHKTLVQGIVRDITMRRWSEIALKQSEEKYRRLFEDAALGIFRSTLSGKLINVNAAFAKMFGYASAHDAISNVNDAAQELYKNPEERFLLIQQALNQNTQVISECNYRRKDGSKFIGILFLRAVKDEHGILTHLEGFIEDITDRKSAEKALQESQAMYKLLADNADDVVWTTDKDMNFTYVSPSVKLMYGYEPDEFLNLTIEKLLSDSAFTQAMRATQKQIPFEQMAYETPCVLRNEYPQTRKDGGTFWAEIIIRRIHNAKKGNRSHFIGISRDVTHRKQAEDKLKASLKEKELLLRELYHRTKNNMQVISSLLALQTRHFQDAKIKAVFQDTENRIRTMALVHEKLYQSESLININLEEYIQDLVKLLATSYEVSANRISVRLNTERVVVAIDFAIPCGLVLNELISNAFKHAFPGQQYGEIQIGLHKTDDDETVLYVSDNGVGLPKTFDIHKAKSLGLKTIFTIVEQQLHGEVDFSTKNGLTCRCTFSKTLYTSSLQNYE